MSVLSYLELGYPFKECVTLCPKALRHKISQRVTLPAERSGPPSTRLVRGVYLKSAAG